MTFSSQEIKMMQMACLEYLDSWKIARGEETECVFLKRKIVQAIEFLKNPQIDAQNAPSLLNFVLNYGDFKGYETEEEWSLSDSLIEKLEEIGGSIDWQSGDCYDDEPETWVIDDPFYKEHSKW